MTISQRRGSIGYEAIAANAVTAWEEAVDHPARAIGPLLPYPDWNATPDKEWIGNPDEDAAISCSTAAPTTRPGITGRCHEQPSS